jgi:hypothetical protein
VCLVLPACLPRIPSFKLFLNTLLIYDVAQCSLVSKVLEEYIFSVFGIEVN